LSRRDFRPTLGLQMPMPARVRSSVLALVALLLLASPAHALTVGIADNKADMFGDPRFGFWGVSHARVTVAWDALSSGWQTEELDTWMNAARIAHVDPLVSFGHSRTDRRRLPTPERFLFEFRRFRARYPWVNEYATWNEANHCGEPTCHRPALVAAFYRGIRRECPSCRILAAEVLDMPNMVSWVRAFRRRAREEPRYWGLHNYIDANRFRTKGTKALLKAAPRGNIWFTETGGLVVRRNGSRIAFPGSRKHAAKATKQVFKLARLSKRIRRVYIYHWTPQLTKLPTWDSALMDPRGKPRPAYQVLKRFVLRFAREAKLRKERARGEATPAPTPTPAPTSGGAPAPAATPSPTPAP